MRIVVTVTTPKGSIVGIRAFEGKKAIMDARAFERLHADRKLRVSHKIH